MHFQPIQKSQIQENFMGKHAPGPPKGLTKTFSSPLSFASYSTLCWHTPAFPGIFFRNFAS